MLYPKAFKFWEEHTNTPCGSNKTQLPGSVWTVTSALEYLCAGKNKKKVKVLVAQLCSILCDPMDWRMPGFSVHVILQARILEWVLFPSPGDLPNPGTEPRSLVLQAHSLSFEPPGKPRNSNTSIKMFLAL